jgi:hypothetical protein
MPKELELLPSYEMVRNKDESIHDFMQRILNEAMLWKCSIVDVYVHPDFTFVRVIYKNKE